MSGGLIILWFVVYFICAFPFFKIMFHWEEYNKDLKNDHKIHLLMIFVFFILPVIVNIPFYIACHK